MDYRVIILPSALREIKKLPVDVQRRIMTHVILLEHDPRPNGAVKLQGIDRFRIRVGDYRVIYTIEDDIKRVTVVRAAHRREVYR
ncbi:MAG: type II toxin-antitoxin system RelE/ParE family toxin [Chloroflexi bacterium]|nr:type II toxin-antitoxin system RelE/ParE family toxin [Chloroflexota bacterium]MCL5273418.1 type II toxin-antitoxin system RelE/ParE family toxin [Chloroflexota bacterium]